MTDALAPTPELSASNSVEASVRIDLLHKEYERLAGLVDRKGDALNDDLKLIGAGVAALLAWKPLSEFGGPEQGPAAHTLFLGFCACLAVVAIVIFHHHARRATFLFLLDQLEVHERALATLAELPGGTFSVAASWRVKRADHDRAEIPFMLAFTITTVVVPALVLRHPTYSPLYGGIALAVLAAYGITSDLALGRKSWAHLVWERMARARRRERAPTSTQRD